VFLKHLDLIDTIEIRNSGGVTDLSKFLEVIKSTRGFENVDSLAIIRDAELDATGAFSSICGNLRRSGFSVPGRAFIMAEGKPKISVFILPDCRNPGMLETLCWESVRNDLAISCVEEFFQCVNRNGISLRPNILPKAKIHSFLSSRPRPNLLLGQAAHEGYWPWQSSAFDQLREFLHQMVQYA